MLEKRLFIMLRRALYAKKNRINGFPSLYLHHVDEMHSDIKGRGRFYYFALLGYLETFLTHTVHIYWSAGTVDQLRLAHA